MARYNLFETNKVFVLDEINENCDRIFAHVKEVYPEKVNDLFIGGSVGLILQGEPAKIVKDIDIIVTDRTLFDKLFNDLPKEIPGDYKAQFSRFWIKTDVCLYEFWYVLKNANIVNYNGILLEKKSDILIYKR